MCAVHSIGRAVFDIAMARPGLKAATGFFSRARFVPQGK